MTITVQPVPARHPYVERLRAPGTVHRPDPAVPGAPSTQWWPPRALQPDWIAANAHRFDLLHVHFGTEHVAPAELPELLAALDAAGRPLVYTVHDIEHPHLDDTAAFDAQLRTLAAGADALITLTPGAADHVEARVGTRPHVIPHPRLAPRRWFSLADERRADRPHRRPVVGMHLRALRANVRPGDWLVPLAEATVAAGGEFVVYRNDEPLGAGAALAWQAICAEIEGREGVRIVVRPRPDDDALAHELSGLDLSVLPYRHGTHSGWAELCWDLGVAVASPEVGFIREQHRDPWFQSVPLSASTAAEVVAHAMQSEPPPAGVRLLEREQQLDDARRAQTAIYEAVLSRPPQAGARRRARLTPYCSASSAPQ